MSHFEMQYSASIIGVSVIGVSRGTSAAIHATQFSRSRSPRAQMLTNANFIHRGDVGGVSVQPGHPVDEVSVGDLVRFGLRLMRRYGCPDY